MSIIGLAMEKNPKCCNLIWEEPLQRQKKCFSSVIFLQKGYGETVRKIKKSSHHVQSDDLLLDQRCQLPLNKKNKNVVPVFLFKVDLPLCFICLDKHGSSLRKEKHEVLQRDFPPCGWTPMKWSDHRWQWLLVLSQTRVWTGFVWNEPDKLQAPAQPQSGVPASPGPCCWGRWRSAWALPGLSQPGVYC